MRREDLRRYGAELIGTFCLVFAGTGAIVVNDLSAGALSHVGISITFGLIVTAMIYAVGDISGAHLNPAVTAGFYFARVMSLKDSLRYCLAQCLGALLASLLLAVIFPAHANLGMTLPRFNASSAFVFEVVLTFILMFVIIHVSTGAKEKGVLAGIAIGATVALGALTGGPVSGASMNPARSLAPMIAARSFDHLWLYTVAPPLGSLLAIGAWRALTAGTAATDGQ